MPGWRAVHGRPPAEKTRLQSQWVAPHPLATDTTAKLQLGTQTPDPRGGQQTPAWNTHHAHAPHRKHGGPRQTQANRGRGSGGSRKPKIHGAGKGPLEPWGAGTEEDSRSAPLKGNRSPEPQVGGHRGRRGELGQEGEPSIMEDKSPSSLWAQLQVSTQTASPALTQVITWSREEGGGCGRSLWEQLGWREACACLACWEGTDHLNI